VSRLRRAGLVSAFVLAGIAAAPAQGLVSIEGTGEPAFTNTTTNTVFVRYQGDGFSTYRLHFRYITGGQVVHEEATSNLGNPASNVAFADWGGVVDTLLEGHTYSICTQGETQDIASPNWVAPTTNSTCQGIDPRLTATTIDRTKPAISVAVSGADVYTKTVPIPVTISYSDNLAFPFPANFICSRSNMDPAAAAAACNAGGPTPQYNFSDVCSVPANPSSNVTSFSCSITDSPPVPDGPVTLCAISADGAIPDNPASSNQNQTADKANLSAAQCGYVIVDRTAPGVSFTAPATVHVGDLVNVSGTVTDAGSGASPTVAWTWGDNTANGSGMATTHTFTQAGTYTITMATGDNAGNAGQATQTITVSPPPPPGAGAPGGGTSTGGGGTVTPPPTANQIAQQSGVPGGAGATQTTSAGGLDVLTAKKLKLSKRLKALPLALTAESAGRATFALVRAGRIVAKAGLNVTKPGSLGFRLKLPKKLKAGRYRLKISFTPAGAAKASVKTISVTFIKAAKKKKKAATARAGGSAAKVTGAGPARIPDGTVPEALRRAAGRGGVSVR
jgi:PKD repeat protein